MRAPALAPTTSARTDRDRCAHREPGSADQVPGVLAREDGDGEHRARRAFQPAEQGQDRADRQPRDGEAEEKRATVWCGKLRRGNPTRRAALTTFTLTRTGALIVATEFDTKKEELDKTQTELDAAKDTVTKKQAELDEAKAADEAAKQKHEELVADIAAKQEEIDKAEATSKSQAKELEKLQQEVRDKDGTIEEITSTSTQTQAKLDEVEAAHEATKQSNAEQAKEIESLKQEKNDKEATIEEQNAAQEEGSKKRKSMESELEEKTTENEQLQTQLGEKTTENEQLQKQLDSSKAAAELSAHQIEEQAAEIDQHKASAKKMDEELSGMHDKLKEMASEHQQTEDQIRADCEEKIKGCLSSLTNERARHQQTPQFQSSQETLAKKQKLAAESDGDDEQQERSRTYSRRTKTKASAASKPKSILKKAKSDSDSEGGSQTAVEASQPQSRKRSHSVRADRSFRAALFTRYSSDSFAIPTQGGDSKGSQSAMLAATQSRPRPSGASSSGDESNAPIRAAKKPRNSKPPTATPIVSLPSRLFIAASSLTSKTFLVSAKHGAGQVPLQVPWPVHPGARPCRPCSPRRPRRQAAPVRRDRPARPQPEGREVPVRRRQGQG